MTQSTDIDPKDALEEVESELDAAMQRLDDTSQRIDAVLDGGDETESGDTPDVADATPAEAPLDSTETDSGTIVDFDDDTEEDETD